MKDFLMGLYLKHGARPFVYEYKNGDYSRVFTLVRNAGYIEMITRDKYDAQNLPYKLTAKALEYIKTND